MRLLRKMRFVWGLLLASAALVLGYIGYRTLPGESLSPSDAFFGSLQLFALDAPRNVEGMPWQLNVARFLAPLAVVYTTVVAILALVSDRAQQAYTRAFAREHVVIVGLNRFSAGLSASLRRSGRRVVVIASDEANEHVPGTRASGALVLVGDATRSVILGRARAGHARHVVVDTGDDARNLEVAECVRRLALEGDAEHPVGVHVSVSDHTLWTELGRLRLAPTPTGVTVELYNLSDRAAQALIDEAEEAVRPDMLSSVLIEGAGVLSERVLVHVVRRARLAGDRPRIYLGSQAADLLRAVRLREPWLLEAADVMHAEEAHDDAEPVVALVCMEGSDTAGIARGLSLANRGMCSVACVFVEGGASDRVLDSVGVRGVRLVAAHERAASDDFLRLSGLELMARVRHQDYVEQEARRGMTADENPSLVVWEELPESLKESNRRFAESVGAVISELGGFLAPLEQMGDLQWLPEHEQALEELARKEHDRWVAALRKDGWAFAAAAKDPVKKTHPLLIAWEQLPEDEKEKDRDAIRAIPRMLARVGYAIRLPQGVTAAPTVRED